MHRTEFAFIDGVETKRPEGQDKPVKAFGLMSPITRIAQTQPTKRFTLWFISNYPYAFNIFFHSDYVNTWGTGDGRPNAHLAKYMAMLQALKDEGLVRYGDRKRLTYKITTKGQIYRIYTHSTFNFWAITLGVLLAALGVFKDDIFKRNTEKSKQEYNKPTQSTLPYAHSDSYPKSSGQILPLSVKDSDVLQIDTTKTKDTTKRKGG